jgi:uncharacterized protein YutE (UPF0331/DUF86 family)
MTFIVERLVELRRHLQHLRELTPRVTSTESLERDLSLHNDVLFSLFMVSQAVIDIASELAARQGIRFQDYREAIGALGNMGEFPAELVDELSLVPGFRNVLVHEYVKLDYSRVLEALDRLAPLETFVAIVSDLEAI